MVKKLILFLYISIIAICQRAPINIESPINALIENKDQGNYSSIYLYCWSRYIEYRELSIYEL